MNKLDLIFKISQLFKIIDRIPIINRLLSFIRKIRKFYYKLTFLKSKESIEFMKQFPNVRLINPYEKTDGYSGFGQDIFIYNTFFKNKKSGVFMDIGANHPIDKNNTYLFEKKGWIGYAFEPQPSMFNLWGGVENIRLNTQCFNYAVSDQSRKEVSFYTSNSEAEQSSSIDISVNPHYELLKKYDWQKIKVKCITIADFCLEKNISHIDFMSIDVEGFEMQVLRGIDFNGLNINVLCIENLPCLSTQISPLSKNNSIFEFMKKKNYMYYAKIGYDEVYIKEGFLF